MFNDSIVSYIRTIIPMLVGLLASWLQTYGVDIDSQAAIGVFITIVSALYYVLVRVLEQKFPKFGWLLGIPAKPSYTVTV